MTDFIHEHPKDESPTPPPAPSEPPLDEKTGQKRVYGYIFILFIVAFSLLLWAFLMNQRSTDQVLSELRGSASAMQTTMERNVELERQTDELRSALDEAAKDKLAQEREIARLNEELAALTAERDALRAQVEALTPMEEAPAEPNT